MDDQVDLRERGGLGAGGFLAAPVPCEDEVAKDMPDQYFELMLRDRLLLPVCPPGATCQHRSKEGTLCRMPLDPRGKHALKCEVGASRTARHNGIRDFTAEFHSKVSGYGAFKEQRVSAWDRHNPRARLVEEARLDVATRDAASGHKIFVDACARPALIAATSCARQAAEVPSFRGGVGATCL